MIYKRFSTKGSNPHIKLWNNELERLFDFKSLPKKEGGASPKLGRSLQRGKGIFIQLRRISLSLPPTEGGFFFKGRGFAAACFELNRCRPQLIAYI